MNEQNSENKSTWSNRIFYTIFILLIVGSVGFTFSRIVIQKDYQIIAEVFCDPAQESCFHYEGVTCDEGDDECVPEESYDYKIISKKAANIYACEQTDEKIDCGEELSCLEGESNCSYTNCDLSNLDEAETCSIEKGSLINDETFFLEETNKPEILIETDLEQATSTEELTPEEI